MEECSFLPYIFFFDGGIKQSSRSPFLSHFFYRSFCGIRRCTILLHIVSASAVFLFACSFVVGEEARNMWVCPKEA
jgi:glutamine amidotransferase-like uncharacterized protein